MKIKIELLSDLCTYSGESYNSVVDTDVVYDKYGLPFIPARRMKGCIREACMELEELGCKIKIEKKDGTTKLVPVETEKLFGKEGDTDSAFFLSNAYLERYSQKVAALKTVMEEPEMSPQKVLDLYTYTRTQTAVDLETGTAKKNTLRTMRVVKKGLVFEAELRWNGKNLDQDSEEVHVLKSAVSMVKHIGCSRTRGLGLVNMELLPDSDKNRGDSFEKTVQKKQKRILKEDMVNPDSKLHKITYQVDLKAPVICKAATGNQASTQDYIAGSKILGLLAGMLGQDTYGKMTADTDLIVSNAYILCKENRTIPARNSWQKQKDQTFDENGEMNVWEMLCEPDVSNMQMTPAKIHYIDEYGNISGVDTEISYHHTRPDDKGIGRATGKDNSSFYQLASIQSGQSFGGYILADAEQAKEIIQAAGETQQVRIGYGKNTQFGDAIFQLKKIEPVQDQREKMKDAVVTLVSDVILYNENGVPSVSMDCFREYLCVLLGINNTEIQIEKSYLSFTTVGGYNTTWKTFKPVIPALEKGSVFVIHTQREFEKPEVCFVGERVSEGFGEIKFDALPEDERCMVYKPSDSEITVKEESIDQELLGQLQKREEIRKLEKHIRDVVGAFEKSEADSLKHMEKEQKEAVGECANLLKKDIDQFGVAVTKLRAIYQSVKTFGELKEQISEIASDKTKKACENLRICMDPEKLAEQYQIGEKENDAYRKIYHVYLTELKYLVKIVKKKQKEAKKYE